jgi:hypothetical protein
MAGGLEASEILSGDVPGAVGLVAGVGIPTAVAASLLSRPRAARALARALENFHTRPTAQVLNQGRAQVQKALQGSKLGQGVMSAGKRVLQGAPAGVPAALRMEQFPARGSVTYAPPVAAEDEREQHAAGGKVGKRDYPAKRLSRIEKAVLRAQKAIAEETKPLMQMPDSTIAHALEIAKDK